MGYFALKVRYIFYKSMNILQICSKPPYPEKDGYALAVNHITNSLIKKGVTIHAYDPIANIEAKKQFPKMDKRKKINFL